MKSFGYNFVYFMLFWPALGMAEKNEDLFNNTIQSFTEKLNTSARRARTERIETACRTYIELSRPEKNLLIDQSIEGLMQHRGQEGVLLPNQIKPMPRELLESLNQAHYDAMKSLRFPLTYHASKTHDYIDTLRQCRIAAVGIEAGRPAKELCKAIIFLHLLDDIEETGLIQIHNFIRQLVIRGRSQSVPNLRRIQQAENGPVLLVLIHRQYVELLKGLPRSHRDLRVSMFNSGMLRMFKGADLFGEDDQARQAHKERLASSFRNVIPEDIAIKNLISGLDPLYVAFTVNTLFEVVEAYSTDPPRPGPVHLANLLYGPIVNFHNIELEIQHEHRASSSVPNLQVISKSLQEIVRVIQTLNPDDQAFVLRRLPWMLEAFAKVLPLALKQVYFQILISPELRDSLDDWSDEEINELKQSLGL